MAGELGLEKVSAQRGWEALKAIGWSIQRPRPRNPKAATATEQEAFKKKSPKSSPRRPQPTPSPTTRSPRGIRLLFLPACTPELQPAESLWQVVDEPIVNKHMKGRAGFNWWPTIANPS